MPELPEVETIVRALVPLLRGRVVCRVQPFCLSTCAGTPALPQSLIGCRVSEVSRYGKFILIGNGGSQMMALHLRMTGRLDYCTRAEGDSAAKTHLRLALQFLPLPGEPRCLLLFRDPRKFGRAWFGPRPLLMALPSLARLGPDPLTLSKAAFIQRLSGRKGRLKSLLLDQTFLAGLGNIYTDESLFQAGIHPLRPVGALVEGSAGRLYKAIRWVLRRALRAGGSTLRDYRRPDGSPGLFTRQLFVYGREGQPCHRCRATVRRMVAAGRGTWFCPRCQPEPGE
jgi:formamidopyrimidine-DNA glycosylase